MPDQNWVGKTPDPPSLQGVTEPRETYTYCAGYGHDFEMAVNAAGDLVRVDCAKCGQVWKCEPL